MNSPEHQIGMYRIIDALGFGDEALWRQRQALVAAAELDEASIVAACGFLHAAPICFAHRMFDLLLPDVEPEPAFIIAALDTYERLLDLVAWPIGRSGEAATFGNCAALLGEIALWMHPADGSPLMVHRTPAAWIRHGFAGVVPLDLKQAAPVFLDGSIPALRLEDDAHAAEMDAARRTLVANAPRLLVPRAA